MTLLEEIEVEKIIISKQGEISENYQEFLKLIKQKNANVIVVEKGDRIFIEKGVCFDILWPQKKQIQENILNNNSIVAKLNYNDFSMLFTGDIEEIAEEKILKEIDSKVLKSDVLKVAHHGSKSSSTQDFIKTVNPKIALIGVGENNTFGHPNEEVVERLKNLRSTNF